MHLKLLVWHHHPILATVGDSRLLLGAQHMHNLSSPIQATQIAIDTPQLNHRHVAVLNDAGDEIFEAPIRSKPPVS